MMFPVEVHGGRWCDEFAYVGLYCLNRIRAIRLVKGHALAEATITCFLHLRVCCLLPSVVNSECECA